MSNLGSWATSSVSQVAEVIRGITFPASDKRSGAHDGYVACLRTTNVQKELQWDDIYFVPRSYVKRDDQLVRTGDILMSMANSYELVGKVARAHVVPQSAAFGAFLAAVRPVGMIDGRYLYYFLRTAGAQAELRAGSSQTTNIANISAGTLGSLSLPIAPAAEQRRIADKLDTVLARVDAVNDRLARVAPLLKRFRQSVLAAATSGKLTEEWRGRGERPDGASDLPARWTRSTLAAAASNRDNLRRPISEAERRDRQGPFPYYGASGAIDTINGYTHEGEFLLIGEDGANLLSRSKPIAFRASGQIWINNHAHVLTHESVERLDYLGFAINASDLAPWVTGSAQPKLTRKAMDSIPVLLPPDDEQAEVVRRVRLLFAYADRLEARLQAAQTATERLTPTLLAKAFRGELVPQDPNDEPASELLKRLAAQRGASSNRRRARGR
jgi:type I restriction enzyme S subunit